MLEQAVSTKMGQSLKRRRPGTNSRALSVYPKLHWCGPDEIRTRDLGLDRAACLAATPRDHFSRAGRSLPCALISVNMFNNENGLGSI